MCFTKRHILCSYHTLNFFFMLSGLHKAKAALDAGMQYAEDRKQFGKSIGSFMRQLEAEIEPASDKLMAEAGFVK